MLITQSPAANFLFFLILWVLPFSVSGIHPSTVWPSLGRRGCSEIGGHQHDSETLASYAISGNCYYYSPPYSNHTKSVLPCQTWCAIQNNSVGYGCAYNPTNESFAESNGLLFCDDDEQPWIESSCLCNYKLADDIFNLVAQALAELPHILCTVALQAFDDILEIGLYAIPGGAELEGVMALVSSAKTWLENGLDAASFFTSWVGDVCDMPDWTGLNIETIFLTLAGAADSLGTSKGCFKKATQCITPKAIPDPPKPKPKDKGGLDEPVTDPDRARPPTTCPLAKRGALTQTKACKTVNDLEDLDYGWEEDAVDGTHDLYWKGMIINNMEHDMMDSSRVLVHQAWNKNMDKNPRKVPLRDIVLSYFTRVRGQTSSSLQYITYTDVVEEDLTDLLPEVYAKLGRDLETDKENGASVFVARASSGGERDAFTLLVSKTPFGAGARKMLEEYPDFAGRVLKGFNIVWKGSMNFEVHFPK